MIYNPLDTFYKSKIGAVCENETVKFRVKGNFDSVIFLWKKDGEDFNYINMIKNGDCFECDYRFNVGLYFYCFLLSDGRYISNYDLEGVLGFEPICFQLTSYSSDYTTPSWFNGEILYQIFPDRFNSSGKIVNTKKRFIHKNKNDLPFFEPNEFGKVLNNDFYGGNIKGIIEKLSYLKELNVGVIYLNPIFEAFSNHRYDTGDYFKIDEMFGSLDEFKELIKKAKEHNIKIILDGVFNHTGDDSVYFNKYSRYKSIGAYNDENSPYKNWYKFGKTCDDYESWWGIKELPATNKLNNGFIDFITGENGVIDFYTKLGIDGWRLDVVDELPSDFVKKIRCAVKRVNKNALIIGEVWEDASNKISYDIRREYLQGYELDSVMNYPLKNAIFSYVKYGNSKELINTVKTQIDHYPSFVLNCLMNILSTHDTARLISSLDDRDLCGLCKSQLKNIKIEENKLNETIEKLKIASLLLYTINGVPSIYYGDEVGMQGYIDPFNRCFFDWENINTNILEWYKKIGKIRKEHSCFIDGKFNEIYCKNGLFCFSREDELSEILVLTNTTNNKFFVNFDGKLKNLIDNKVYENEIELQGYFAGVFVNM